MRQKRVQSVLSAKTENHHTRIHPPLLSRAKIIHKKWQHCAAHIPLAVQNTFPFYFSALLNHPARLHTNADHLSAVEQTAGGIRECFQLAFSWLRYALVVYRQRAATQPEFARKQNRLRRLFRRSDSITETSSTKCCLFCSVSYPIKPR